MADLTPPVSTTPRKKVPASSRLKTDRLQNALHTSRRRVLVTPLSQAEKLRLLQKWLQSCPLCRLPDFVAELHVHDLTTRLEADLRFNFWQTVKENGLLLTTSLLLEPNPRWGTLAAHCDDIEDAGYVRLLLHEWSVIAEDQDKVLIIEPWTQKVVVLVIGQVIEAESVLEVDEVGVDEGGESTGQDQEVELGRKIKSLQEGFNHPLTLCLSQLVRQYSFQYFPQPESTSFCIGHIEEGGVLKIQICLASDADRLAWAATWRSFWSIEVGEVQCTIEGVIRCVTWQIAKPTTYSRQERVIKKEVLKRTEGDGGTWEEEARRLLKVLVDYEDRTCKALSLMMMQFGEDAWMSVIRHAYHPAGRRVPYNAASYQLCEELRRS